jgi:hypothetical protein
VVRRGRGTASGGSARVVVASGLLQATIVLGHQS